MKPILKLCGAAFAVVILVGAGLGLGGLRLTLGQGARPRPSPTPTAAQDIKRAEDARRRDEEHARLTAVAKEILGRKLEQVFTRCPDGHRYALQPERNMNRSHLFQFRNLSWDIRPTPVNNYDTETGLEWGGAVFTRGETPYYQEYDKETGGWKARLPLGSNPFAYGIKLKDKDWELKSDYAPVDCSLVTSSKQTILEAIDPRLAAINRDFAEAGAHADALMKRMFKQCAGGVWCMDDCFISSKLYVLYPVHYQFIGLRPEVKPNREHPGEFNISFVAESSRIHECDVDSNKTVSNCGWRSKGKEETDTRLTTLVYRDKFFPTYLKKEGDKWFLKVFRTWGQNYPEWVEVAEALTFTPIDYKKCK